MTAVIINIACSLVAAAIGAGVVWLRTRGKSARDRRTRKRLAAAMGGAADDGSTAVMVGTRPTGVHLIEGNGDVEFRRDLLSLHYSPNPVARPPQVETARNIVLADMSAAVAGVQPAWQGETLVALTHYSITRADGDEHPELTIRCCPVDYATFSATVTHIDRKFPLAGKDGSRTTTLRTEFLEGREEESVRAPVPFLANGVGLALVVFTEDDRVILTRRRASALARPNELDVSVIEGMHNGLDRDGPGRLNPYRTAIRGCSEELGLEIGIDEVTLLGFGVDMTYYQWNFFGSVQTRQQSAALIATAAAHAKDRFEGRLLAVLDDPAELLTRVKVEGMWDSGLVALYYALCHRHGTRGVKAAAERVFA